MPLSLPASWNPQHLWTVSLVLAALGIALLAGVLAWRLLRASRAEARLNQVQQARAAATSLPFPMGSASLAGLTPSDNGPSAAAEQQAVADSLRPPAWLESPIAKALLADEDRKLLDQAGLELVRGGLTFVVTRTLLAVLLPILLIALLQPKGVMALCYGFFGLALGIMGPKWWLRAKAGKRRAQVVEELPLFVDLLRLLQGVGLSIDQSLQILASEFGSVLRIISSELGLANRLYSSGRTREQSLQRLATLGADDDMNAVVNLLVQVDRHGGAVQEPLREFSVRLREKRQAGFKEKIGTITVKMTGVMVLTLLPALLVITAGPGFTAVIRSLSSLGGR
ncbi:secretion system protein [Comamonas serinivorans]|uniref:Secretion system protein n=1 Tax=Comamonas serinivorans TaxID=1082851 RepID=A0A1Y0EL40_9BURK|nr:type II secretion system F family protein [Comamonas serinivorans]ARU04353.1 secretion system protein [Comamonas serinivorans]